MDNLSTGQVAKQLGISASYAKLLAVVARLDVPRVGGRRSWNAEHVRQLAELVKEKRRVK